MRLKPGNLYCAKRPLFTFKYMNFAEQRVIPKGTIVMFLKEEKTFNGNFDCFLAGEYKFFWEKGDVNNLNYSSDIRGLIVMKFERGNLYRTKHAMDVLDYNDYGFWEVPAGAIVMFLKRKIASSTHYSRCLFLLGDSKFYFADYGDLDEYFQSTEDWEP